MAEAGSRDQGFVKGIDFAESFSLRAPVLRAAGVRYTLVGPPDRPDAIRLEHHLDGYGDGGRAVIAFATDLELPFRRIVGFDRTGFDEKVKLAVFESAEALMRFYREHGDLDRPNLRR